MEKLLCSVVCMVLKLFLSVTRVSWPLRGFYRVPHEFASVICCTRFLGKAAAVRRFTKEMSCSVVNTMDSFGALGALLIRDPDVLACADVRASACDAVQWTCCVASLGEHVMSALSREGGGFLCFVLILSCTAQFY